MERITVRDHYAAIVDLTGFARSYPHELSGGILRELGVDQYGG
jgi:ABC-type nitrate/sulfonate/bicarbonate transport system ATPase subunit